MRVLHFYRTYFPDTVGGVEQVINQLVRGTITYGIESEVVTLTRKKAARTVEVDGHRVHRAQMDFQIASTGFSLSAFKLFARLAQQADIIHYHFPWPFMDLVHFMTRMNKPTVVTYHSDIIKQKYLLKLYRPLKHRFLSSVNRIVATSPNYLATSQILDRYRDKTTVIPIGLDKASYPIPTAERLTNWRERFGSRFYLFVGMIRYYKGLHFLLEAAEGLDYPIVICGTGPLEGELKAQAAARGLKNVHFLGKISDEDKVALLTLCYGVVFPSHLRSEAFGISLLEGAMFGKPMISCEIGTGTTFINSGGETGLVIPPADPCALRNAMQYLWEHPDEAAAMGRRAEERYWDLFTADKMVREYVNLYHELVDH